MKIKTIINSGKYIVESNDTYTLVIPPHSNYGIIRNNKSEVVKFYTYDKEEMDKILGIYGFKIDKEY